MDIAAANGKSLKKQKLQKLQKMKVVSLTEPTLVIP